MGGLYSQRWSDDVKKCPNVPHVNGRELKKNTNVCFCCGVTEKNIFETACCSLTEVPVWLCNTYTNQATPLLRILET